MRAMWTLVVVLLTLSWAHAAEPTIVETIPVCGRDIAVNSLTNTVYVPPHTIDGRTHDVTSMRSFWVVTWTVRLNPIANRVYLVQTHPLVGEGDNYETVVLDGRTHDVIASLAGRWRSQPIEGPVIDALQDRTYLFERWGYLAMWPRPHWTHVDRAYVYDGVSELVSMHLYPTSRFRAAAVNPVTHRLYRQRSSQIWISENESLDPIEQIQGAPGRLTAVDPVAGTVYLYDSDLSRMTLVDEATFRIVATVQLGSATFAALDPLANRWYAIDRANNSLMIVDGRNGQIVSTIALGREPGEVAVNPLTGRVYVMVSSAAGCETYVIDSSDPARPPRRVLSQHINNLMVEAGGASGRLQDALAHVQAESYEKAAHSLMAFSQEIENQTLSPELGEKLAIGARKIIVMMIGN